jgi:fatty-acyl-CoA synthase
VERGDTGEIWTASPTLMHGYLDDAESTAQVMRNGWLRTGDLGHLDKYGYLNLDGRVAEVIKVGGLKVNPAAVEQALLCHPAVANAAVYGLRGADYIEVVHAAVQLRVGARCTGEQLRAHVSELLSPLASPSEIELWTRLPLNDQAKPDKTYLRSRHIRRNTSLEKTHDLASTFRA